MMSPAPFSRVRRRSRVVHVGGVAIGGDNPIRVQSMITCDTMDTEASIAQTLQLADVGCEIVRITAPTVKDAANLQPIVAGLRARGCHVPIVADIHFKPEAAMEAAKWVEKVRINPGNFADSKKFNVREYSDAEYAAELDRIREKFTPLVKFCREHGRAMRIGTNHGSLSDRIMNRYGDTPLGMVESALEFARIARDLDYHAFVFSMKSSNPKVMIEAYRLLAARLDELEDDERRMTKDEGRMTNDECRMTKDKDPGPAARGEIRHSSSVIRHSSWLYPLHLGVTEAGDGEDGRIKSAIGIGSLLADGIGDTVRVSLTEDSIHEIPVARALVRLMARPAASAGAEAPAGNAAPAGQVAQASRVAQASSLWGQRPSRALSSTLSPSSTAMSDPALSFDPFTYERRATARLELSGAALGGEEPVRVAIRPETHAQLAHKLDRLGDYRPELTLDSDALVAIDPRDDSAIAALHEAPAPRLVTVADGLDLEVIPAFRLLAARLEPRHPILLKDTLAPAGDPEADFLPTLLRAAAQLGSLLCDGIGDAVLVQGEHGPGQSLRLAWNILQAAGCRVFKTDYVACPSCGRTLFNLQETTARIKAATAHLKGVKIAIMGCIVNGPGEMADADFGYVGGAPGKINLYVGKKPVKFNIPQAEAVDRLKDLIREHGKWLEPAVS